jgi:NADPH-dependent curcumin reductase CurA
LKEIHRMARAWQLASRPNGAATRDNFKLIEIALPPVGPGEVRVRNHFLSVEPAMRAMMEKTEGNPMWLELDEPIFGRAVATVTQSRSDKFAEGDLVFHYKGWRDEAVVPAAEVEKLPQDPAVPMEYYLSTLGMPGVTAYFGLTEIGRPKAGETLFVSAAAGSVGSNVLQIGKALGLTVIGSAGGPEKCALLRELGADVAIDYREGNLQAQLKAAAPGGIDIYFDNVGGEHLDAALGNAATFARFVECGMIDGYDQADARPKVPLGNLMRIVASQITLRGFIVSAFEHRIEESRAVLGGWLKEGTIRPLLTITDGLEKMPDAFLGLFSGQNTGKAMVRL